MSSRCVGHCCKDFTLPFSPIQVERWKKRLAKGAKPESVATYEETRNPYDFRLKKRGEYSFKYYDLERNDIPYILDMLIFLRTDTQDNATGDGYRGHLYRSRMYHYTCKHFDGKDCTAYEKRPSVCQRHGTNDQRCRYAKCAMRNNQEVHAGLGLRTVNKKKIDRARTGETMGLDESKANRAPETSNEVPLIPKRNGGGSFAEGCGASCGPT